MKLPKARNTDLVVQELGRELLIYDLKTHHAYQLNETSMIVFNACDGVQTLADLKRQHKFTDDLIYFTLNELKDRKLLVEDYSNPLAGMNRREVIRRVGLASMIALPMIASITAPQAIHAASNTCANGGQPPYCADLCEEVECPYAQDACHDDGKCDPNTGDCLSPVRPDGTPCDDNDASTEGDICTNGVCAGTCISGRTDCGSLNFSGQRCSDLQTDPNNCGVCSNQCSAGQTCVNGACV